MQKQPRIHSNVAQDYPDFLRDESRLTGEAAGISFPVSESEVCETLRCARAAGECVTTQGARTGITGGAVPAGGQVLNLSRMTGMHGLRPGPCDGTFCLTVEPGLLLSEIQSAVASRQFDTDGWSDASRECLGRVREGHALMFAPDPTEKTASIGGMVACNASGARSFRYGATRRSIDRLRIALTDGDTVELKRGVHRAEGLAFAMTTDGGRRIEGMLPAIRMPEVKNAAGYYMAEDMDLLDLFIGSEGTLGVITELDLVLVPQPAVLWGITCFFASEAAAVRFVRAAREGDSRPLAIEYIGPRALDLLRKQKSENPAFGELPDIEADWQASVYVELTRDDEDAVEAAMLDLSEHIVACGGDEDATWLATRPREIQRFKEFRHAVPEAVNLLIDERKKQEPGLTKLGTDLAVPDDCLEQVLTLYHADLDARGLEYVMFGHIGNNHVHVNIIPRSMEEYREGKALYETWAHKVIAMGGTVSAEHGIGKLKTGLLQAMFGAETIERMRGVKALFDPGGILNRGTLFETE